jgi:hypothetical protein
MAATALAAVAAPEQVVGRQNLAAFLPIEIGAFLQLVDAIDGLGVLGGRIHAGSMPSIITVEGRVKV